MENIFRKERMKTGLSKVGASKLLEVPLRTIENWEKGDKNPAPYIEKWYLEKLNEISISNDITSFFEYKNAVSDFAEDTKEWGDLKFGTFYTTDGSYWKESCDNAHGGLDVSWAFHKKNISEENMKENYVDDVENRIDNIIECCFFDDVEFYYKELIKLLMMLKSAK